MYKYIFDVIDNKVSNRVILRVADNACIPFDPANSDYQEYLKFLAEGGQPLPADSE